MSEAQALRASLLETEALLRESNSWGAKMEEQATESDERTLQAAARVNDLETQIGYLKGQIEIYQARLGLLPRSPQGEPRQTEQRPLRQPRVPFSVAAAKIQADRTEEYWKRRAATVNDGTTGSTSEATEPVSEKES